MAELQTKERLPRITPQSLPQLPESGGLAVLDHSSGSDPLFPCLLDSSNMVVDYTRIHRYLQNRPFTTHDSNIFQQC